jgi:hypothetical protein
MVQVVLLLLSCCLFRQCFGSHCPAGSFHYNLPVSSISQKEMWACGAAPNNEEQPRPRKS